MIENIDSLEISSVTRFSIADNVKSSYYKYVLLVDESINRQELKDMRKTKYGVSLSGYLYSQPIHSQPVFEKYPDTIVRLPDEAFPGTEYAVSRHICLPLYESLTEQDIDYTVEALGATIGAVG